MKKQKKYNLYTDASFDNKSNVATYSIIIMLENKILKAYSKKSRIQIKSSTEIEIFAVYQAINLILSCYINKNENQVFCINTDCAQVPVFFENKNKQMKIFKNDENIKSAMIKTYSTICTKLSRKNCSFSLKWISRKLNKKAHEQTYSMFKRMKKLNKSNFSEDDILINKNAFCELLSSFNKIQKTIIIHLLNISNKNGLIRITQSQLAKNLNVSITTICKTIKQLNKLKILDKVKNGKYLLLIV